MSLRARMALFAGAAVAIAVIAVVVAGYQGTRNELQGQVDQSLQSLAKRPLENIGLGPGGGPPPAGVFQFGPHVPSGNVDHDPDEGLGFDHLPPQAFGGASGTFTLFKRGGGTYVPKGQSYEIPSTPAIEKLAATGHGQFFTDMRVNGTHIRVLVTGIGDKGALAVALPLTTVDNALSNQLDAAARDRRRRDPARGAVRAAGGADGARADHAVHAARPSRSRSTPSGSSTSGST